MIVPICNDSPGDVYNRTNIRHVNSVQYSLDTLGFNHDGIVMIIDSDMFLIKPFSVNDYVRDFDIVAGHRGAGPGVEYLWPGLTMLAMDRLPIKGL